MEKMKRLKALWDAQSILINTLIEHGDVTTHVKARSIACLYRVLFRLDEAVFLLDQSSPHPQTNIRTRLNRMVITVGDKVKHWTSQSQVNYCGTVIDVRYVDGKRYLAVSIDNEYQEELGIRQSTDSANHFTRKED